MDIGNQEALFKSLAGKPQSHALAAGRAGAVTGQIILRSCAVAAIGGFDLQSDMIAVVRVSDHFVAPAQIDQFGKIRNPINQILLDVILLQIDEGRHFMAGLRQQIKAVNLVIAMKQPAGFPGDALGQHALANTEPVKNLQGAFCPADRP